MNNAKGYGRRGRSDRRHDGHYGGGKHKPVVGEKGREILENIDANCPVIKAFQLYAAELDSKHDKYERIVKISRDITIESKRIIFLLHTLDRDSKKDIILNEAESRLKQLGTTCFKYIAEELAQEDPYHYIRAYTAGLQEYIEALTFFHYLKSNTLQNWAEIQKDLLYTISVKESTDSTMDTTEVDRSVDNVQALESQEEGTEQIIKTLIPPSDYILGVADLTGELMRKCINNLGLGHVDSCFQTCAFVKEIYNGFLGVGNTGPKEFSRKLYTLRQSLSKMENACYTIHVRGSEIPKYMLADVFSDAQDEFHDEDEGFY